jgi:hypothetical protein
VVHHLAHEIHIGHENGSVTLFKEMVQSQQALLELLTFSNTHVLGQLLHGLGCFGLVSREFEGFNEKLERRFLQYDRGVRSLRLS